MSNSVDVIQEEKKEQKRKAKYKPKKQKKPINLSKVLIAIIVGFYIITQILVAIQNMKPSQGTLKYNTLFEMLDKNEIKEISVTQTENLVKVYTNDGKMYEMANPKSQTFIEDLMKHGANIKYYKQTPTAAVAGVLVTMPLVIVMALFAVYITGTIIGGNTKMFTLLKSNENDTTFDDVKGMSETKKEVRFAVDQLKNWEKLAEVGARPCKGMLLYGPPGTGKTLLAKAIANEAGVPFISASGSDFNEVFVGVGAARVRSLWLLALENVPCIIFIDEIDCLGKRRKGGDGASNDNNQTLNSLLQKMDGLNKANGVLVIAATNRKDDLDDALLRPGRFDKQFFVGPPTNRKDRDELVSAYLANKKTAYGFSEKDVSKLCVGLTGAEVEEALNEAVYISLREGREGVIGVSDVDEAVMKLHTGGVKKEHSSKRDIAITSIHEAGHAIVALKRGIPLNKVSIEPYSSGTGGVTMPNQDLASNQKLKFKSDTDSTVMMWLAGMIAEDVEFGEHTQGCSNDLENASAALYNMVTTYGQGDNLLNENVLMESGISHLLDERVTEECNRRLAEYEKDTRKLLEDNFELVRKLAAYLRKNLVIVSPTLETIEKLQSVDRLDIKAISQADLNESEGNKDDEESTEDAQSNAKSDAKSDSAKA